MKGSILTAIYCRSLDVLLAVSSAPFHFSLGSSYNFFPPSLPPSQTRDQINSEHRQHQLVERSVECAQRLVDQYQDRDGLRQEEIAALGGPDEFAEFYRRLKHLKEHHRK